MRELQLMANLTKELLDVAGYTRETIADLLEMTTTELEERYMSKFPVRAEKFRLRQRALHVFEEALRVVKYRSLLKSRPVESLSLLNELGALMNQTQESCRELYECSCPELDELCQIARDHGAYGSRLTGAGWGGCTVHLVPKDKVEAIKEAWERKYYLTKYPDMSREQLAEAVVVSQPGPGAMLYEFTISFVNSPHLLTTLPGTKKLLDPRKPSPRNRDGHSSDLSTIDLDRAGLAPPPPAVIRQHFHDDVEAARQFPPAGYHRRAREFWRYRVRGASPGASLGEEEGRRLWEEFPSEDGVWASEGGASGSGRRPPPANTRTTMRFHRLSMYIATFPEWWRSEIRPAWGRSLRRLRLRREPESLSLREWWRFLRDQVIRRGGEAWNLRFGEETANFVTECTGICLGDACTSCFEACCSCVGAVELV